MNLLLTGATGFVGQNFISFLSKTAPDIHVFAPVRHIPASSLPQVSWLPFREDWSSYFSENKIDAVIHLLGKAHDTKNTTQEAEYFRINHEYTQQLFDAFASSTAQKFIFLSTIKAVGDDKTYVINALDLSEPQTPYARSKRMAEDYIRTQNIPVGKSFYILRPTLIYGPKVKGNLATLVTFAKKGLPYPFASFENKRSYLSVHNLSFIFSTILRQNFGSFTLNIANSDPVGTQELIELLAAKLDKQPSKLSIPEGIIRSMAKVGDLLPFLPFNSEKLKKITNSFVVDTAEMEKTLRISLPEKTRDSITQILEF